MASNSDSVMKLLVGWGEGDQLFEYHDGIEKPSRLDSYAAENGPVFTTATFIGYVLSGTKGALVATLGIFLPAFVFVDVSGPLVPRIRRSPTAGAFLDGVNAAAMSLMVVVTYQFRLRVHDESWQTETALVVLCRPFGRFTRGILMALQSQLFRGDPKLEAAAVSDPAHLVPGASGPHVVKIQQALIQLDAATIVPDGVYGQATAAAVSAFKQKRQILNFQNQIDNIVGKKTMAALDSEMLALEAGGGGGGLQLNLKLPGGLLDLLKDDAKVPPGLFWGVDSSVPITPDLLARVLKLFGRPPEYWGRYITKGRDTVLQKDEIPLLRKSSPGTRLVLIHNPLFRTGEGFYHERKFGVDKNGNQTVVGFIRNPDKERLRGVNEALKAKSSSQAILQAAGIKLDNVVIYMNIEVDQEFPRIGRVSPDFIRGWWSVLGFDLGGIYGNVSEAIQQEEARGAGRVAFIGNAYNDARGGTGQAPFLWGQFPKRSRKFPVPQQYAPNQPPGSINTVRIWQYGPTLVKGDFDMNLANKEGFDKMIKL